MHRGDGRWRAGCRGLTLGQYLRPSARHHPIVEFVPPERFERLRRAALELGFAAVASGPFVRSSYNAGQMAHEMLAARRPDEGDFDPVACRKGTQDGA